MAPKKRLFILSKEQLSGCTFHPLDNHLLISHGKGCLTFWTLKKDGFFERTDMEMEVMGNFFAQGQLKIWFFRFILCRSILGGPKSISLSTFQTNRRLPRNYTPDDSFSLSQIDLTKPNLTKLKPNLTWSCVLTGRRASPLSCISRAMLSFCFERIEIV